MKVMVVSDLHLDINENILKSEQFGFIDQIKNVDVVIIAGDISGDVSSTISFLSFLEDLIIQKGWNTKVLFTIGNHEPYSFKTEELTVSQINSKLSRKFKKNNKVTFLQNSSTEINGVIFYGSTFGTNFFEKEYYKVMIRKHISDFYRVYDYTNFDPFPKRITPDFYVDMYNSSLNKLKNICKRNKNKEIVVFTHFAPSIQSVAKEFSSYKLLNSYFVNNLDDFIQDNPNIKYWCHGHTHSDMDYVIGECRIICNPYGYWMEPPSISPKNYNGIIFTI